MYTNFLTVALGLASVPLVASHPGEDHHAEAMKRREFLKNNVANLDHCAGKLDALGVTKRSIQRRHSRIHGIREKRGLVARDQHHEGRSYNAEVSQAAEFKSNSSCVLSPEEILGPYCTCRSLVLSKLPANASTCRCCRRVYPLRHYRGPDRCAGSSGYFLHRCQHLPAPC